MVIGRVQIERVVILVVNIIGMGINQPALCHALSTQYLHHS